MALWPPTTLHKIFNVLNGIKGVPKCIEMSKYWKHVRCSHAISPDTIAIVCMPGMVCESSPHMDVEKSNTKDLGLRVYLASYWQ
jgi:hypothetical protein